MFEELSEKLNTTFIPTSGSIEDTINSIEKKKNEIKELLDPKTVVIKDQYFLDTELKSIYEISKTVLENLANSIRAGSDNRSFEVYAKLLESLTNTLREIREMNKMISDMMILRGKLNDEPEENNNGKIQLTSDQLMDMINKAKENSELNKIDAEFKIED